MAFHNSLSEHIINFWYHKKEACIIWHMMWGITMHLPENIIHDKLSNMVDHDECMYSISQKRNLPASCDVGCVFLNHKTHKIKGQNLAGTGRNSAGKGQHLPDPFFTWCTWGKNTQYIIWSGLVHCWCFMKVALICMILWHIWFAVFEENQADLQPGEISWTFP